MTACFQNSRRTIPDRIERGHEYWTQAYDDVCVAIDREIKWREKAEKHETELRMIKNLLDSNGYQIGYGYARDYVNAAISSITGGTK